MKKKFSKILGVALPLAMVIALAVMLLPAASTPTTEAAAGNLRFGTMSLPRYVQDGGRYVLVHDQNVGPIAVTAHGGVLFAASDNIVSEVVAHLFKSGDDGYTWTELTGFAAARVAQGDPSGIMAILASPEYATDTTVLVATDNVVYQSVDGGSTFSAMPIPWSATGTIQDMDVAMDSGGRLSIIVGTLGAANVGEVYVYSPATTGMTWQAQLIGTRNVLAVAFSPNFASDEGIAAVTTNGTAAVPAAADTTISFSFGNTKTGAGWAASVGDGTFVDTAALDIVGTRARIGFPEDFDDASISSNVIFVGLSAVDEATGAVASGDVYRVTCQPTLSTTSDLNVRGLVSQVRTVTDIYSLDVQGDAAAATIMVGTNMWSTGVANYYWTSYISTDSGVTWSSAREKSPTGGAPTWNPAWPNTTASLVSGTNAMCFVLLSPDFATSGKAWAATSGNATSAVSRSLDGGTSWNQISFIDYSNNATAYVVLGYGVQDDWATSKTALMMTCNVTNAAGDHTADGGAAWKTTDGGAHYERIWSYANPTATRVLNGVSRAFVGDANVGQTIFVTDELNGRIWRSTDYGATFPRVISAKAAVLDGAFYVTPDMIWTWYADGNIWTTTNLGRPWVQPEESLILGEDPVFYAFSAGSLTMVPTGSGNVYVSDDGGVTFTKTLGSTPPGGGGAAVWLDTDANYDENHYVYATVMTGPLVGTAGGGIWRIEVNEEDPESTEWEQIDTGWVLAADAFGNTGTATAFPTLIMHKAGITYMFDMGFLSANNGGIVRCLNPEADMLETPPPTFAVTNTGLTLNAWGLVGYYSLSSSPTTIFMRDYAPANYWTQVVAFIDLMSEAPAPSAPTDGAADVGVRLSTTDLTLTETLFWGSVPGATSYQFQLAFDEDFDSLALNVLLYPGLQLTVGPGTPVIAGVGFVGLIPAKTYYWRMRADAPIISPWSEVRSFATQDITIEEAVPTEEVVFDVVSPGRGESGVPVQPVFVWSEVAGAESYEVVVAEDKTFSIIEWSHTADTSFYQGDEVLAYGTTYYWRVRAAGGEWANGVFTTVAKAVEEEPAVVIEKEPAPPPEIVKIEVPGAPEAIPSYLLWTIIGVGAVLIIALIVLIVRTRRVT